MNAAPVIELRGVSVEYGEVRALADATAAAAAGQLVALVGPNGAGKSTLLKAIVGAVRLSAGSVSVAGMTSRSARREMVTYVPQHESVDWGFPVSVLEVVALGDLAPANWRPWSGRAVRGQAREALARVGMDGLRARAIGALSGGQQQRAMLARALMREAPVLLLDEPLSGVDPATREDILVLLRALCGQGRTVLTATHDVEEASRVADRAWGVHGSIVADVPAADLLLPEVMRQVYGEHLVLLSGGTLALGDQQH
ncbi:MAG: metal ABC transporter ATP-binding protein [Candidatus Dormibacteria bacterium]